MTIDDRAIDRLVDGELTDGARRELLALVERSPEGWRRLALAFLEDQSWKAGARTLAQSGRIVATGVRPTRPQRLMPRLAIAAGWLLAFAAGWGLHPRRPEVPTTLVARADPPIAADPTPDSNPSPDPEKRPEPPDETAPPPPDEAMVKAWERRGFQVEKRERLVSVGPPNGPRRSVPVQELRLRYLGNRTF